MNINGTGGWEWTVYPRDTDDPMVACGITSLEAVSRLCVEEVMTRVAESLFGVLVSPAGHHDICRRVKDDGGLKWQPMFPGWRGREPAGGAPGTVSA